MVSGVCNLRSFCFRLVFHHISVCLRLVTRRRFDVDTNESFLIKRAAVWFRFQWKNGILFGITEKPRVFNPLRVYERYEDYKKD